LLFPRVFGSIKEWYIEEDVANFSTVYGGARSSVGRWKKQRKSED
jgi:hypothetical protein